LTHRNRRDYILDQMRCRLNHVTSIARWANSSIITRERN
jgi:hypothetical protein